MAKRLINRFPSSNVEQALWADGYRSVNGKFSNRASNEVGQQVSQISIIPGYPVRPLSSPWNFQFRELHQKSVESNQKV